MSDATNVKNKADETDEADEADQADEAASTEVFAEEGKVGIWDGPVVDHMPKDEVDPRVRDELRTAQQLGRGPHAYDPSNEAERAWFIGAGPDRETHLDGVERDFDHTQYHDYRPDPELDGHPGYIPPKY